jgi:hypothetical protein
MSDNEKKVKKSQPQGDGKGGSKKLATLEANGDSIQLSEGAAGWGAKAMIAGVVFLVAAIFAGGGFTSPQFQHSYLTAYTWALSISVGGVWWVTLQHLFGSRASVAYRRVGEVIAKGVWVMAILALPVLIPALFMHSDALYPWATHEGLHKFHVSEQKAGYFSTGFLGSRMVAYFAYFIFMSNYWLKKSLAQDKTSGDVAFYKKLQGRSAPAMIGFALAVTFCAIDLLMTLDPMWFSTIFGVYYFATCVTTFHSVLALTLMWMQKNGTLKKSITIEHYHDVGKMMFAFVCFWSYIGFSQFMLIWYANLPEETHWFHVRMDHGWWLGSMILAATHFLIPFFGMMSRSMKRNTGLLRFWCFYLLIVCWFDMYWLIAPNLHPQGVEIGAADILAWLGMIGIVAGSIVLEAKKVSLVATGDPRLPRALAFENI